MPSQLRELVQWKTRQQLLLHPALTRVELLSELVWCNEQKQAVSVAASVAADS